MDKKLKRVQFFYDDGSSKFIEGNELDKWGGFQRQVAIFCNIHNNNPDWASVKWTEVPAEPVEQLNVEPALPPDFKSSID